MHTSRIYPRESCPYHDVRSSGSTVTSCAVSAKPAHSRGRREVSDDKNQRVRRHPMMIVYLPTRYYQQTCIYWFTHVQCAACASRQYENRVQKRRYSHAGRLELLVSSNNAARSFFLDTPPPLALLCVTVCGPAHIPPGLLMAPPLIPLRLASVAGSSGYLHCETAL